MAILSKAGIVSGSIIEPAHVTQIIDALTASGSITDVLITGSLGVIGPNRLGISGSSSQSPLILYPDDGTSSTFYTKNPNGNFVIGTGVNPYGGTDLITLGSNGNTTLSAGILTLSNGNLSVTNGSALSTATGSQVDIAKFFANVVGNSDSLEITNTRILTGSSWTTSGYRIQEKIDSTWMGYIQFNGGNNSGLSFGAGTSTVSPISIPEILRLTTSGIIITGSLTLTGNITSAGNIISNGYIEGNQVIAIKNSSASGYAELQYYEGVTQKANIFYNGSTQTNFAGANSFNIYQGENAPIAFYTNTTERMRITGGGNVGIGSSSPTSKLYIEGGASNWSEITPGTTVGTIHLDPGASSANIGNAITFGAHDASSGGNAQAGVYVRTDGAYGTKMYFATTDNYAAGSKTRLFIDSTGNIGIGTTSVSSNVKLTVIGDGTGKAEVGPWSSGGNYTALSLNGSGNSITDYNFLSSPTDYSLYINRPTGGSILFRANNSNQMIINAAGQVGIGTIAPSESVTISGGGIDRVGASVASTVTQLRLGSPNSGEAQAVFQYNRSSGAYQFSAGANGDTSNPDIVVLADGKVGIGTTTPIVGFEVAGSTSAVNGGKIRVSNPNTTDYAELQFSQQGTEKATVFVNGSAQSGYGGVNSFNLWQRSDTAPMVFHTGTSATERMRITTTGNIGINTTTPTTTLDINGTLRIRSLVAGTNTAPGRASSGEITALSSDKRLKKDISTLSNSLSKIKNLRGVNFKWDKTNEPNFIIDESEKEKQQIGLIAQEVELIYPELVYLNGVKDYKGVRYPELTAVLIEAIKEQQTQIETLKQQVATLISGSTN